MRAMVGLIRPTSGTVELGGTDPWGRGAEGPSVGLLPEAPAFLDAYTGMGNLRVLASMRGQVNEAALAAALEAVGLDPADPRRYRAYPLDMKRRLGLAAAVAGAPDVLVLDEPTNALDARGVELAAHLGARPGRACTTVIMACHDAAVRSLPWQDWRPWAFWVRAWRGPTRTRRSTYLLCAARQGSGLSSTARS